MATDLEFWGAVADNVGTRQDQQEEQDMDYINDSAWLALAERYATKQPIGYSMTDGFSTIERLNDIDGEQCWRMTYGPGESWCGGVAEAAELLVNFLTWDAADYRPEDHA